MAIGDRQSHAIDELVGVARHLQHIAVPLVEAANLRQIGGHHRHAHREVFVQLHRIHAVGEIAAQIRDERDVEAFDVCRHLIVRPRAEQAHVGPRGRAA